MPTLLLRFPGRRYHATPWGHHVNEGLIEWPPSPWRLLRALISVGYTSGSWNGSGLPPAARSLIEKLAGTLPLYRLPAAVGAHSRHYMPVATIEKGRERTTLVFDTWAQVHDGDLAVMWNVQLTSDERSMLAQLVERLAYLGRSESWVAADLLPDEETAQGSFNCFPDQDGGALRPGVEQVSLLAARPANAYKAWRDSALAEASSALAETGKKATAKVRRDTEAAYPPDIVASLQAETRWLRSHGWNQPPGSRRVFYLRQVDALEAGAPRAAGQSRRAGPVEAMLLSLTSASGNDRLLPPVIRTVPQAELLHRALVSQVASLTSEHSAVLTGCDDHGQPLRAAHRHAHVLPLDLDGDGHLDHVLIWAPMTLDADAQAAVRAARRTFTKGGEVPLRVALAGVGALAGFRTLPGEAGARLRRVLGPGNGATAWVSATPFVPPRFLKKHGRHTLDGQIGAELTSRGLPQPSRIDVRSPHDDKDARRHRHFVRARRFGPAPPMDAGFTVALHFDEPVVGPLCLGYGSHFGLGVFRAVT